jgi:hypothetical protein
MPAITSRRQEIASDVLSPNFLLGKGRLGWFEVAE